MRISSTKGHKSLANMELECGECYLGRRDTSKFLFKLYKALCLYKFYDFFVLFFNAFIRLVHDIPSE